jgi:HEAT repeat protein
MWFFALVCFLCLLAVPVALTYYAGNLLIAPVFWLGKRYLAQRSGRRLLESSAGRLRPTSSPEVKRLFDTTAFTRPTLGTRDHEGEIEGLRVLMRTQPRTVDINGSIAGFPWSRQDQVNALEVIGCAIVIDLRERIPREINLHVQFGSEETSFGSERTIAAILDGKLRAAARRGDQLGVGDGLLMFDSPFAIRDGCLDSLIAALVRAGTRLVQATWNGTLDEGRLLLENLEHDGDVSVRSRSTDVLLSEMPQHRQATLAIALKDASPEVRFAAARHLKSGSFEIIQRVIRDPIASDGLSERALRHMIRRFKPERTVPVLRQVLEEGDRHLVRIAVRHLGELRHQPAVSWMDDLAQNLIDPTGEIAAAIAQALGSLGSEDGEPTLLLLLDQSWGEADVDVKVAVADALGNVGTRRAVEKLLVLSKTARFDKRLRRAAEAAVQAIRSRLGPYGTGALSLVEMDSERGALSIDGSGPGALSPPKT